jgi:hypothetical protein
MVELKPGLGLAAIVTQLGTQPMHRFAEPGGDPRDVEIVGHHGWLGHRLIPFGRFQPCFETRRGPSGPRARAS